MIKNRSRKTVIQKITFTKKEQEEIDLINKGEAVPTIRTIIEKKTGKKRDIVYNRRFTFENGHRRLVQLYGGGKCRCGDWPSYKVLHFVGDEQQGAWLVERYCQKHYDEWQKAIK